MIRKSLVLGLVASGVVLAGASLAAGDEMKNAIGNTVKRLDTGETMYWKEDYTYVRKYNGVTETGKWKVENGQVCTEKGTPEAGKQSEWACYTPVGDHKVGDTWEVDGTDGTKFKVTMIAGEA